MNVPTLIFLVVIPTGIFLLLLYLTIHFYNHHKIQQQQTNVNNKRLTNYYVFQRGVSSKPLFNWSDNPSLVTDAVENGWSRFAFTNFVSSPSVQPSKSVLGYCGVAGDTKDAEVMEIAWEVCQGSGDFMQKIRLNSGLGKVVMTSGSSMAAVSVAKSALPLPGPALGNSSPFPQEAYFEITILPTYKEEIETQTNGRMGVNKREGEKIKLIKESPIREKASSESFIHVITSSNTNGVSTRGVLAKIEELKGRNGGKVIVEGKTEMAVVLSVGLAGGGSLPLKLPGSYPGSIGFNSDSSIYLEGVKLTADAESVKWGKVDTVIGCGYNPREKKVYFTIDAKLVREVHCMTEEFETPLYPILASNTDVTVLVNFGQSDFKYTHANPNRVPNPCFIGQLVSSPVLEFDDSKELFSMGRIDTHWSDRSIKRSTQYFGSVHRASDYDESSEGSLFEIVLDSNSRGRSPSTHF